MQVVVYRNITRKCWSLLDLKSRRLIGHADSLRLSNARFQVSESGRQRVLREKRKNVHAFVIGEIEEKPIACITPIGYNPYFNETFVCKVRQNPITTAECVEFASDGKVYAKL
jgi:hypothetical protein